MGLVLDLVIPGPPRPKDRPRLGKNGAVYTPRRTGTYEYSLRVHALAAMARIGWPHACPDPICVHLTAYFPDKRRRDLDNVVKCLDGLNDCVWADDSQILELHAFKKYDPACPRLLLSIEALT